MSGGSELSSQADNLRSWTRRGEVVFVVAAALWSIVFWLRLPGTLPSEDDYRAGAAHIASEFRPGDVVLVYPAWAEHWRVFLDVAPVMAIPHPESEDFTRTKRLWLAGLPDAPRSDYERVAERLATRYHVVEAPQRFGKVAVALYENPGYAEPMFDFRAEIARAHVSLGNDPCVWDGHIHRCRAHPRVHVGDEVHEIDFLPRRCIWAHPAGAVPLVIRFEQVPIGRQIRVRGGITNQEAWRKDPNWGPLSFDVFVGQQRLSSLQIEVADGREQSLEVDTSALSGTSQDVTFTVAAPRPDYRQFCFDATAW